MNKINSHWSIDTTKLKEDEEAFTVWDLEQRINWGIGEGKINKKDLLKYWDKIDIDPFKRKALSLSLFPALF